MCPSSNCLPSIVCIGGGKGGLGPLFVAGDVLKRRSRLTLTSENLRSSRNLGCTGNSPLSGKGIGFVIGGFVSCFTSIVKSSLPPKVIGNVPGPGLLGA